MAGPEASPQTLRSLWAQFLPLSVSDVTMMAGDPLITGTLTHLPDARLNLAAVGVAKAVAVFFESPIIMILHASNVLGASAASRRALWRFVLVAAGVLMAALALLSQPGCFGLVGPWALGVHGAVAERGREVLLLMVAWPAAIAWRRYFQGLLIRAGRSQAVARAGVVRLAAVVAILAGGLAVHAAGYWLAGVALVAGILVEAGVVTWAARRMPADALPPFDTVPGLPVDGPGVWRFYWPLANSMLVVWGGRAVLVALVARAVDAPIALAAWPAAWGFVLLVANATRMVQQVIIRNRDQVADGLLVQFAFSVGATCSLVLLGIAATPPGRMLLAAFVGQDAALLAGVQPVVLLCSVVPLIVALQNAVQGFLIGEGRTGRVNAATWVGTAVLLSTALTGTALGLAGATAAAVAMIASLAAESCWLGLGLRAPRAAEAPIA